MKIFKYFVFILTIIYPTLSKSQIIEFRQCKTIELDGISDQKYLNEHRPGTFHATVNLATGTSKFGSGKVLKMVHYDNESFTTMDKIYYEDDDLNRFAEIYYDFNLINGKIMTNIFHANGTVTASKSKCDLKTAKMKTKKPIKNKSNDSKIKSFLKKIY